MRGESADSLSLNFNSSVAKRTLLLVPHVNVLWSAKLTATRETRESRQTSCLSLGVQRLTPASVLPTVADAANPLASLQSRSLSGFSSSFSSVSRPRPSLSSSRRRHRRHRRHSCVTALMLLLPYTRATASDRRKERLELRATAGKQRLS